MYQEINEQLDKLRQDIARLQKIESMAAQLKNELSSLRQTESELRAILEKENLDVTKLENKSIASVFYSIVGSLDERLQKERREAFSAKLKHDQALKEIEDVENRLSALSTERSGYANCQADYKRLFEQKKAMLMRDNASAAQRIMELNEKIGTLRIQIKEIGEAVSAGDNVLDSLESVLRSLNRAESWGTWDMFGGGLLSDLEKHSNIDDARYKIETTKALLRSFHTELADVKLSTDIDIHISEFSKFADFFFDGLFADWNMQNRINSSQDNILSAKNQVKSVISRLNSMQTSDKDAIRSLETELNSLVINA